MQSLEARQLYRNSFHCVYRIFTEEGIRRFWTGATPRLMRLSVSRISVIFRMDDILMQPTAERWDSIHRIRKHHPIPLCLQVESPPQNTLHIQRSAGEQKYK